MKWTHWGRIQMDLNNSISEDKMFANRTGRLLANCCPLPIANFMIKIVLSIVIYYITYFR